MEPRDNQSNSFNHKLLNTYLCKTLVWYKFINRIPILNKFTIWKGKKRHLLLGRKAMTNLDSVLKSRDITLLTKICIVKAIFFLVVMYRCESWSINKAECQRTNVFKLWFWRRLLRIPWTAKRSNLSILKEISPEYSLKGLVLKLKL